MKHVFYIHSNITALMFESIVHFLKLQIEDVFLITDRNINGYLHYDHCDISDKITKPIFFNFNELKKTKNYLLQSISFDEYKLYVPHCSNFVYQVLTHDPKCKEINIIEEGLLAYLDKDIITRKRNREPILKMFLYDLKIRCFSFNQYKLMPYIVEKKVSNYYCFSDSAFLGFNNKIVLSQDALTDSLNYTIPSHIYCLTDYPVLKIEMTEYLKVIIHVIKIIKANNVDILGLKLHPSTVNDYNFKTELEKIVQSDSIGIKINFLPKELILEKCLKRKRYTIYGTFSSLQFYALVFGNKVYSDAKLLKLPQNYLETIPEKFRDKILFLDKKING